MDADDSKRDPKAVRYSVASAASLSSNPSTELSLLGQNTLPWYRVSLRTIVLISLPILSLIGAFQTMVLSNGNGTFKLITALIEKDGSFLPGSDQLILKKFTGLGFVDQHLSTLVLFFAPTLEVSNVELSLFCVVGFGQFGAAWTLMVMESMRFGNKGKYVSFIGTVGFIFQNITFAITVPLYLLLHILTSPVAKSLQRTQAKTSFLVSPLDLSILPFSIVLSYVFPSLLMGLPSPSLISSLTHQRYIAFWQPFPIWTVVIHSSIRFICQFMGSRWFRDFSMKSHGTPSTATYFSKATHVYRFVVTLCISTHVPVILLTLFPFGAIGGSTSGLKLLERSNFINVFIPHSPFLNYQVSSIAAGVHTFLQWDMYVGLIAFLIWATLLYCNIKTENLIVDSKMPRPIHKQPSLRESAPGALQLKSLLWKICFWVIFSGPMGAVAILLWERDAVLSQKYEHSE